MRATDASLLHTSVGNKSTNHCLATASSYAPASSPIACTPPPPPLTPGWAEVSPSLLPCPPSLQAVCLSLVFESSYAYADIMVGMHATMKKIQEMPFLTSTGQPRTATIAEAAVTDCQQAPGCLGLARFGRSNYCLCYCTVFVEYSTVAEAVVTTAKSGKPQTA